MNAISLNSSSSTVRGLARPWRFAHGACGDDVVLLPERTQFHRGHRWTDDDAPAPVCAPKKTHSTGRHVLEAFAIGRASPVRTLCCSSVWWASLAGHMRCCCPPSNGYFACSVKAVMVSAQRQRLSGRFWVLTVALGAAAFGAADDSRGLWLFSAMLVLLAVVAGIRGAGVFGCGRLGMLLYFSTTNTLIRAVCPTRCAGG